MSVALFVLLTAMGQDPIAIRSLNQNNFHVSL